MTIAIRNLLLSSLRPVLPWQHNGTWTIQGVTFSNMPTLGSELLTDGALENWTTATNSTSWTEAPAGASTINQETVDIHGGASALRLDIDGSGSSAGISQAAVATIGKWYLFSAWLKSNPTAKSIQMGTANSPWPFAAAKTLTAAYAQSFVANRASGTSITLSRNSATSSSLYADDLSLKEITLNTLFAVISAGITPSMVAANVTAIDGLPCGVVVNLDSLSTPLNFVIGYHNGAVCRLEKCVAGVFTNLVNLTVTQVAGSIVEVRKPANNIFQLWYAGTQRSGDITVNDAGILSNTLHGGFNTSPLNTLTNLVIVP